MEKLGFTKDQKTSEKDNYIEAKTKVMSSLKDFFRPEFLNRVDDILIFDILSPEIIKDIVKIQVDIIMKRLEEKSVSLSMSQAVYDYLAKEGYNPQYGARPLKRLIQNKILTPVANLLISQQVGKGGTITVDAVPVAKPVEGGDTVKLIFETKKKKRGTESPIIVGDMQRVK